MRARLPLLGAIVAGLVAVALVVVGIMWFLGPRGALGGPAASEEPLPRWAPPAAAPIVASAATGPGIAGLADPSWLAETAQATGIPQRALAAYAGAAIVKAETMPECGLSWATLAGIGATESDHGRHGGSTLDANGTATPGIFGVALNGDGVALIPDSDGGAIDGDAEADRAVGPMQLIPEAWRNWHVDGGGDGIEDPQNIDDAALAAANYLCRSSTAFDTEDGWRAGIRSYNSPEVYLGTVAKFAIRYAAAVSTTPLPAPSASR
ncbi:MAG: murein transglycosylase [Leifsonia xyli]|nr:MAG: murein transglycosylase [Leifsonia xyli]